MTAVPLALDRLVCGHGRKVVVADVSLALAEGEMVFLLGPNGVGKTTLFKTALRLLAPLGGTVRVDGADTAGWSPRRFAQVVGYVPQAHAAPFPFAVRDVVAMGRAARLGAFRAPGRADFALAEAALDTLGIGALARSPFTAISGGERQLVLIARALAQHPRVLVMDEPASNLDYGNQIAVLDHVAALCRHQGIAVLMTTHDPNHALAHGDRVATIDRQGRFAVGRPGALITEAYLRETYRVRSRLIAVERDGGPGYLCLPLGREGGQ